MRTKKVKYYEIEGTGIRYSSLLLAKSYFAVDLKTWKERVAAVGTRILGYDYSGNLITFCSLRRVANNGRLYFTKSSRVLPSVVYE